MKLSKLPRLGAPSIWCHQRHPSVCRRSGYRRPWSRQGTTLVEMLTAMAVTLIMILAMAQMFKLIGGYVSEGRAVLEMSGQMRGVAQRLEDDLEGVTVPARPWPESASALGYLEIVDGLARDSRAGAADTVIGDYDDVLMFTSRSTGQPFVGQVAGTVVPLPNGQFRVDYDPANPTVTVIESRLAEIIWWMQLGEDDNNGVWDPGEDFTLHRKVLLVRPDLVLTDPDLAALSPLDFYNRNDVSVRRIGGAWVANSLADLTKRENRFAHNPAMFPHVLLPALLIPKTTIWAPGADGQWGVAGVDDDLNGNMDDLPEAGWLDSDDVIVHDALGEDLMLPHALAFDLRVYDPTAPLVHDDPNPANATAILQPGDDAYALRVSAGPVVGQGAYVDLNYGLTYGLPPALSTFSGPPHPKSQLPGVMPSYDTWSLHYEQDGINQNLNALTDEGTNGLDDDGLNGVDDVLERETSAPYPLPLRGLQVTIRMVEHDTRQLRQVTIVSDFTPE